MTRAYCIMKSRSRAWGASYPVLHEVCDDRKTANARCKALNAKAQSYSYEIHSAPVFKLDAAEKP